MRGIILYAIRIAQNALSCKQIAIVLNKDLIILPVYIDVMQSAW